MREPGDTEQAVLNNVNKFVEKQLGNQCLTGSDHMIEGNGRDKRSTRKVETETAQVQSERRLGNPQRVGFNNADSVKIRLRIIRAKSLSRVGRERNRILRQGIALSRNVSRDGPSR